MLFVKVSETENQDDSVEIPVETEGYILMSTLTAQFPGACGLKFKTEQSAWRGVRVADEKLHPAGDEKWSEKCVYIITYPKDSKRKGDDLDVNSANKSRKIERKCVDLIVLGIPWKSTDELVKRYFEQYGDVVLCEVKKDALNNSKGFGFVRFKEYNNQCSVLGKKHFIDGRWCDVKIPNSQEPEASRKIFVGRLSEGISSKDLNEYFSKYGQVIDVYIPKPFRAFGFVTFVEGDIHELCKESHIIKGISVHVSKADPKEEDNGHSFHSHQRDYYNSGGNSNSHQRDSYRNEGPRGGGGGYNGASRNGHDQSHHNSPGNNSTSMYKGGRSGGGPPRSKMNKHDHSGNDLYDSRRSPNMPPHHHQQQHQQQMPQQSMNGSSGQNYDQMNAMMSMFNPMMAAFIQQLATQTNMVPSNSQSIDNGGNVGLGGHHQPGQQWSSNNPANGGSNYSNTHSRYKS